VPEARYTAFMQTHDTEWQRHLIALGYAEAQPLGVGMEGAVYRLGDGRVAKVWARRSIAELERLQHVYRDVLQHDLGFQTPEILEVAEERGMAVTIERELHGVPLARFATEADTEVSAAVVRSVIIVIESFARVTATDAMRRLAVLNEDRPLWEGSRRWGDALAALIDRRVARFGDLLRRSVERFDAKRERVQALLAALDTPALSLVHGDLVPANILVDGSLRPTAVLDFGFFSTTGDPAFEAAVTASIFNMYGPHARAIEGQLDAALMRHLGYSPATLALYRAAYALTTSNAFDRDGKDGHFAWCAQMLERPDITAALLS
jgi:aminoglycoside phosphotransferase